MMTDPATAIKHEVLQLVELQIETLRRGGRLTDCDLEQYRARSGRSPAFIRNSIGSEEPGSTGNLSEPLRFASV